MWYVAPCDFYWFDDARMRLNKNSNVNYSMLVTAEGAMGFYFGNCDAYGSNYGDKGLAGSISFPNLKANDVIISAPKSDIYNCTAWAGGITNGWFWGGLYASYYNPSLIGSYYGNPYVWDTWDSYFGNNPPRYSGAITYTRDEADANNAAIALWSINGNVSGVTHGSVRADANMHPHGYDWESKAGRNYRFFHPRDALSNFNQNLDGDYVGYGAIFAYYRDVSRPPHMGYRSGISDKDIAFVRNKGNVGPFFSFEESLKKGLTVIEAVELNEEQQKIVSSQIFLRNSSSFLRRLYDRWIKEISSEKYLNISNPFVFIKTKEGRELLEYGKNNLQESVLFFADIIFSKNPNMAFEQSISQIMFCEMAKGKYAAIIEKIKDDSRKNSYTERGSYIAPLPETFTKKYIKEILDVMYHLKKKQEDKKNNLEKINDNSIIVSPNPVIDNYANVVIRLPETAFVTVSIFGTNGVLKQTIIQRKKLGGGSYTYPINTALLDSGVNVCIVEINGNRYSRKILKK